MTCETRLECVRELEYLDFLTFDTQIEPNNTRSYWQTAVEYSHRHKSRIHDCRVSAITDILDAESRVFVMATASDDANMMEYTKYILEPARCYIQNSSDAKYQQQYNMTIAEALNKSTDLINTSRVDTSIITDAVNRVVDRYCAEHITFPSIP